MPCTGGAVAMTYEWACNLAAIPARHAGALLQIEETGDLGYVDSLPERP